jgi:hypothetical protein
MIMGMQANLVNKPRIKKMEQNNSAKITRHKVNVEPRCKKSMNLYFKVLK